MIRKLLGEVWDVPKGRRDILAGTATETVERVLNYLHWRERASEIHHRSAGVIDYRLTWALVFQAFYGDDDTYRRFYGPAIVPPELYAQAPAQGRAWRELRPLRRVVARLELEAERGASGRQYPQYREVLSCGHILPARVDYFGEKAAGHRRCQPCAEGVPVTVQAKAKRARA